METQKNVNLLNGSDDENSNFATTKWSIIDSQSKRSYSHKNPIKFLTSSLESSLCDYSDAYFFVTRNILKQFNKLFLLKKQINKLGPFTLLKNRKKQY